MRRGESLAHDSSCNLFRIWLWITEALVQFWDLLLLLLLLVMMLLHLSHDDAAALEKFFGTYILEHALGDQSCSSSGCWMRPEEVKKSSLLT